MRSIKWMLIVGVVLTVFVFANSAQCFWNHTLVCGIINMVLGMFDLFVMVRLFYIKKHYDNCRECLTEYEESTDK